MIAGPLVPWIWGPISNPGEVYTRSENVGNLIVVSVVFCGILPFIALAGFFEGRLGRRLRPPSRGALSTAFLVYSPECVEGLFCELQGT